MVYLGESLAAGVGATDVAAGGVVELEPPQVLVRGDRGGHPVRLVDLGAKAFLPSIET